MISTTVIQGRFTDYPELKRTPTGKDVCKFTIACERDSKGKDGKRFADFIDCVAWDKSAEFVSRNFKKGQMTVVVGRLTTNTFKDSKGVNRKTTELVVNNAAFCGSKPDSTAQPDFEEIPDYDDLPFGE